MRKRIYEIIEAADSDDHLSHIYDVFMVFVIITSIIPLGMKHMSPAWYDIDNICVTIYIIDYILRLITADYKMGSHSIDSFLRYPLTPMAIVDLVSILPHFIMTNSGFGLLRLVRLARAMRVVRIFKIFRYSDNIEMILAVIKRSKDSLITVGSLTLAYIITSALIMLNVEPETFDSFLDAVYWATVSLTTIGYGDIVPSTPVGKLVIMISSFIGIGVIALPAGIITAGYMEELQEYKRKRRIRRRNNHNDKHDFHHRD